METVSQEKPINPPKEYLSKTLSSFINWIESLNIKYSLVGNPPVYDKATFPWVAEVEKEWKKIRAELEQIMEYREELPSFHEIVTGIKSISQDKNWKTFILVGYGREVEKNCRRCPETARILRKIPGMKTAFFSILSPGKHIPPHKGPYNGVLRYHLGLIVPEPKEECRIRIHNQFQHWSEGDSLIFDDTYNHEVWNDTSGHRVVLFVDFVRPIKFPFNLLNRFIIYAGKFTSSIREAYDNQRKWGEKFYK
ncbi:MAG TPA: aspartyl/asparaginyl beta-hydroxylase domain-containing protein [Thermodesulfobacteriota bacterium]|nr:aspartyl/asparaginyl beta-hydroxylase domain-containing protein [Thermodesulfobacteriota bacterium]